MKKQGSKTVYKYPLNMYEPTTLDLSGDPVLVSQQEPAKGFGPLLFLWAEFRDSETPRTRTFEVFGTGHVIPPNAVHVQSFLQDAFVWHVYETTASGGEQ